MQEIYDVRKGATANESTDKLHECESEKGRRVNESQFVEDVTLLDINSSL